MQGDWEKCIDSDFEIVDVSENIALLEDGAVRTREALLELEIAPNHRVISASDAWIISASIEGNLTLTSKESREPQEHFALNRTIASANVEGDTLAVLFADNEMALYDIPSKELLFKEQGGSALVADSRIVPPRFMKELVLFSTLDGKVIIINAALKKRLRTVIVSSEENFNNIIYIDVLQNKIIAATSYKLLSMSQKDIRVKYEVRNITTADDTLYVSTKQGEILSLTPELQLNAKIKLPFAHFLGMISYGDKLYLLEQEGYMIVVDKSSFEYKVYELDIEDGFVFVADRLFYVGQSAISLE